MSGTEDAPIAKSNEALFALYQLHEFRFMASLEEYLPGNEA